MNKSISFSKHATLKSPAHSVQISEDEIQAMLPIYVAMAGQLNLPIPSDLDHGLSDWFDSMDRKTPIHELRQLLQTTSLGSNEESIRGLIRRYLYKPAKTPMERDKLDFLLAQYFALCAPPSTYHKQISLDDAARVMEPVLGKTSSSTLNWCEPFEKMIISMRAFRSLREMLDTDFIEQGRRIKESSGDRFYEPASLLAFTRFSFLVRRTLIELMHVELVAIRTGLAELHAAGKTIIDCRPFGLSASEPLKKIQEIADEWKQPFQKEYTERTVNEIFERLLQLKTAVEHAQGKPEAGASEKRATAPLQTKTEPPAKLDFDTCLEQIWEQLIATPPVRGRSMTTVRIHDARILMSSWEVAAFLSQEGISTEDLQRAVVARAMVNAALEDAKKGNRNYLDDALSVARIEVSRLQERVDIAKQTKDTEAAVNLGISRKRLLSALDEAEKS